MNKRISRLLWIFAFALGLRACVVEPVRVTDESMVPVLQDGDVVLVSKLHYGLRVPGAGSILTEWRAPQKGDLVVAVAVGDPPISVLRRISAVPGDTVTMPDGKSEVLKEGEFFLAAEQKEAADSRKLGPVSRKAIIGKATYVWLAKKVDSPKSDWRMLQPL